MIILIHNLKEEYGVNLTIKYNNVNLNNNNK